MQKKAGILFLIRTDLQQEVWLGKRISAPYEGYWSSVVGVVRSGEKSWETACREAQEELNVDVISLIGRKSASRGKAVRYKIPFLTHITFYPVYLLEKSVLDEQPRFVGNFEEVAWYPVQAPPQKSHLSIHFCLGVLERPEKPW